MPPSQSEKRERLKAEADDGELPYISKSRVKTFNQCPRKFAFKYLQGRETPDNYHFKKGRRLHLTFEYFYRNARGCVRSGLDELPPIGTLIPLEMFQTWGQFPHYLANFLKFERRRYEEAESVAEWLPVSVEEELWLNHPPVDGSPPWMGYADLIVNASTIDTLDTDEGVVVVDFKTGKTPDPDYRDEGIFLEGTFYGMMFEESYDLAGVAGYYPKNDDLLVTKPSEERQERVKEIIREMLRMVEIYDEPQEAAYFDKDESPLCRYKNGSGWGGCEFYVADEMNPKTADPAEGECNSVWNTPMHPSGVVYTD